MTTPPNLPSQDASLILAVPSKGRLQENALAFFARAGLALERERGGRDYRGTVQGLPGVDVTFLSASEIAGHLARGEAHLGITGEDLIRESIPDSERCVALLEPLGFGHANVVVAVPKAWIDAVSMADLEDIAASYHRAHGQRMRVATKYVNLTRRFFATHGIADYRVVESLGATEGAPAAGAAELIVDITTTGATLSANGLKTLDDGIILRSEAHLAASRAAPWSDPTRDAAKRLLDRIAAEATARLSRDLMVFAAPDAVAALAELAFQRGALVHGAAPAGALALSCPAERAAALADDLVRAGAARVAVSAPDYVFGNENRIYGRLTEALTSRA
jgi:ATP phosphoribosyltransferase